MIELYKRRMRQPLNLWRWFDWHVSWWLNRRRFERIRDLVRKDERVLDLGAGDCLVSLMLQWKCGAVVTPVDVCDYNKTTLPLFVGDGQTLPYADKSFDVTLLLSVLHHTDSHRSLLEEAARVTRHRIIIEEDVYSNSLGRLVTHAVDRLLNLSRGVKCPHSNLRVEQWLGMFRGLGLRLVEQRHYPRSLLLLHQVVFVVKCAPPAMLGSSPVDGS